MNKIAATRFDKRMKIEQRLAKSIPPAPGATAVQGETTVQHDAWSAGWHDAVFGFAPATAQEFRLSILDAMEGPTINEIE